MVPIGECTRQVNPVLYFDLMLNARIQNDTIKL